MELFELKSFYQFYRSKFGALGTFMIEFHKKYLKENKNFPNLIDYVKRFI